MRLNCVTYHQKYKVKINGAKLIFVVHIRGGFCIAVVHGLIYASRVTRYDFSCYDFYY